MHIKGRNLVYKVLWFKLLALILALQFYAMRVNAQPVPELPKYSESVLNVSGYVMLDYDQYGGFYDKSGNDYKSENEDHFEIRRSKLAFQYAPTASIWAELEFTYHNEYQQEEEYELADAYIHYKSSALVDIQLGKMKEPFGLERQTGSSKITGIERSMVTTAFSPGRSVGGMLTIGEPHYSVALGLFEEDSSEAIQAVTSRMTYGFIDPNLSNKHLGLSLSHRDLKDQEFQIKERGESNSADNVIRSAKFDASSQDIVQLESAWFTHQFRLQSEIAYSSIEQTNGVNWAYSGFYVQASYLLNKGQYQYKNNKIKTKIKKGTWELVGRYSGLDLQDNDIGSEASVLLLGVNYYINKQFKIMANILLPEISGNTVDDDQSGNGVSMRAQYAF